MGLGNPGHRYAKTRHNVGADVVALLAERHGESLRQGKELAHVAEVRVNGRRLVLAFHQTFMNESGRAVARLVHRYKVGPAPLLIGHDELDRALGVVRGQEGGVEHVLAPPAKRERLVLDGATEGAADAVEMVLAEGVAAAQNAFNSRQPPAEPFNG